MSSYQEKKFQGMPKGKNTIWIDIASLRTRYGKDVGIIRLGKNKGFYSSNYRMYEEASKSHGSWFYPELKIVLTKYSWEYLCYSYRKYYLKNEIDFTCPQKTHPPTQPLSFLSLLLLSFFLSFRYFVHKTYFVRQYAKCWKYEDE